jgi:hypothetical protein
MPSFRERSEGMRFTYCFGTYILGILKDKAIEAPELFSGREVSSQISKRGGGGSQKI